MNITISLPRYVTWRIGGYKVFFEYANALAERGNTVTLALPQQQDRPSASLAIVKSRLWPLKMRWNRSPAASWFLLHPDVRTLWMPDGRARFLPPADVLLLSGWQTAEAARDAHLFQGRKLYMVYDYEYWRTATPEVRARMDATYRMSLPTISTSPAVDEMLAANGAAAVARIPCGTDFDIFHTEQPIAARAPVVGFPVRPEPFKGTADAIEAVSRLKDALGDGVRVRAFGRDAPPDLPECVEFVASPSDAELRAFYNSLSVFLFPSHFEGWGLPAVEAMACGAALVSADAVGTRLFARQDETALVVERGHPDLLAVAVQTLLTDEPRRTRLAEAGHAEALRYTWTAAADALETVLRGLISV